VAIADRKMTFIKRRRLLTVLLLLLLLGGLLLVPSVRWPIYGWLRGEAFYQGMPTSYWREEIGKRQQFVDYHFSNKPISHWMRVRESVLGTPEDFAQSPFYHLVNGKLVPDPEAAYVAIELLSDPDKIVAADAWGFVMEAKSSWKVIVPALVQLLTNPSLEHRRNAACALGEIATPTPQSVAGLIAALADDDQDLVTYAVLALGRMGPPAKDATPVLLELYRRPGNATAEEQIRDLAGEALKKIDPEAAAKAGVK
jgi:HEAT repeat protein